MPTTYTMFFMTTLTLNRCRRPRPVNCLIVFALRVFRSFAFLTLPVCQLLRHSGTNESSLVPVHGLEHHCLGIIRSPTPRTASIGGKELVVAELADLGSTHQQTSRKKHRRSHLHPTLTWPEILI